MIRTQIDLETRTDSRMEFRDLASDLKIKIVGIGGAGTNALRGLKPDELGGGGRVDLVVINTDAQALASSPVPEKFILGRTVTRGLGAGGEIEIGRMAAEADRDALTRLLKGNDLIILVVGLGGGTGSAAATVLAQVAAKTEALVIAFATLPFTFEGSRRQRIAEESLGELRQLVHGLIVLPNNMLLQEGEEDATVLNAFAAADRWIGQGIHTLCAILLKTGLINLDFSTIRSVFKERGGRSIFGTGAATGGDYVNNALEELFMCPLLHMGDRPGQLDRMLVNITGGTDLGMSRVNEIIGQISARFKPREDIVFGAVIDEKLHQSLEVCVLAKAGVESQALVQSLASSSEKPAVRSNLSFKLDPPIAQDERSAPRVHKSKLNRSKVSSHADQEEFLFVDVDAQRGYFDQTDRNLYKEEDLDVPTFLRRGIKIRIKV